ncbi:MAG: hypothetical protein Ct9H300mP13_5340 [Gammaproteobacteria bacterium]|nr:MAG: hypothetical protein Ct9H300mP13_5340 [Gammaproteobacteria bacterium]
MTKKGLQLCISPTRVSGRFRMNVFQQQGMGGLGLGRRISDEFPNFADLRLPSAPMEKISLSKRGLVLFVGAPVGANRPVKLLVLIIGTSTLAATSSR